MTNGLGVMTNGFAVRMVFPTERDDFLVFFRPRGDVLLVFPCFFEPDRVEQYEGDLSWLVIIPDIGVRRR